MNQFFREISRLLDGLFGSPTRRHPSERQEGPLFRRRRYDAQVVSHECGHASIAWMSHVVLYVDGITFGPTGATTHACFNKSHSEYPLEDLVYTLGGLVGEMLVWKKVHAAGLGGRKEADLPVALDLAETVLNTRTPAALERHWRGRLADPSFDVASMFVSRPPREIAEVLNLAYRRGKHLLIQNRAGFDRLCRMAAGQRNLTRQDIESQFGPRLWAPGGRSR